MAQPAQKLGLPSSPVWVLVVLVTLLGAIAPLGSASADPNPAAGAAEAYSAGNHEEAARRYQTLIDTSGASPDLLFNLGTAWGEADQPGRAIYALERARRLAPRDEVMADNLDIIRQRVRIARMESNAGRKLTEGEPDDIFWLRLLTWFDPAELAWAVVIFNILAFAALALRRTMKGGASRDAISVLAFGSFFVLLLSLGTLLTHAAVVRSVHIGVVLDKDVELHQTPTTTALTRPHPDVYAGTVVRVLAQRSDGWTQVLVVDDTVGWLRSAQIGIVQ